MRRNTEQIEDEALAIRARQGSSEALDRLLRRWQNRVWNYLFGLCRDEQAAWDLLQETCLSIARGIGRLNDPTSFPSWCFRLARRRYVDWVRRDIRARRTCERLSDAVEDEAGPNADPIDRIRAGLEQIPADDRAILTMAYLEGFTYEEIGCLLEIPLGTVKSRIHHAKRGLRTQLETET